MTHVHTENKHFQLLETVVSLAHICMQPSVLPVQGWGQLEGAVPAPAGVQPGPAGHRLPAASLLPVQPTPPAK